MGGNFGDVPFLADKDSLGSGKKLEEQQIDKWEHLDRMSHEPEDKLSRAMGWPQWIESVTSVATRKAEGGGVLYSDANTRRRGRSESRSEIIRLHFMNVVSMVQVKLLRNQSGFLCT